MEVERYSATRSTNEQYLRLDMAERVSNFSDHFFESFLQTLKQEDFITYPSMGDYEALTKRLELTRGLPAGSVTLGAGSDTLIKQIFQLTCKTGSEIITTDPCFPMYGVYAKMNDSSLITVPYGPDLKTNLSEIKSKVADSTSLVVLANPNSPIGDYKNYSDLADLSSFLSERGIVFLVDEAYCEYVKRDTSNYYEMDKLAFEFSNVILVRTFSKAWGAAGSRVGYSVADEHLSKAIQRLRLTFPITGASLKYINHLLDNEKDVFEYINCVKEERRELALILEISGFDVIDSNVNWIHFNDSEDNKFACSVLDSFGIAFKRGVTIPHDERKNWIRLTVGPRLSSSSAIKHIIKKRKSPEEQKNDDCELHSILELARNSSILNSPKSSTLRDWMPEPILRHGFSKFYRGKVFCDIGCASGAVALSASTDAALCFGIEKSAPSFFHSIFGNKGSEAFTKICEYAERKDTNVNLRFGADATADLPYADFYLANVPNSVVMKVIDKIKEVNELAHIAIVVPITPPGPPETREHRNKAFLNDDVNLFLKNRNFKTKMVESICGFERFIAVSPCLELPEF